MAGGEFRFGTASIYMAGGEPIRLSCTSHKRVITWLRFCEVGSRFSRTSAEFIVRARGKLGLAGSVSCFALDQHHAGDQSYLVLGFQLFCRLARFKVHVPSIGLNNPSKLGSTHWP